MKGLFITGTDTDCGKTRVAVAMIDALRERGLQVAPFKPVAAGARLTDAGLRNDDALHLIEAAGGDWVYEEVNPYCLESPISPHLAAREAGIKIDPARLRAAMDKLAGRADMVLVEGAGGWMAPLGDDYDIQDLALMLGLPVVLVVGLKLGCLNHARLSAARIEASGAIFAGWVGSQVDPSMLRADQNLETLCRILDAPCLGVLPRLGVDEAGAEYLRLERLEAFFAQPDSK